MDLSLSLTATMILSMAVANLQRNLGDKLLPFAVEMHKAVVALSMAVADPHGNLGDELLPVALAVHKVLMLFQAMPNLQRNLRVRTPPRCSGSACRNGYGL